MIPLRDSERSYGTPAVTIAIIAINVSVFLFEISLDPYSRNHFIGVYGAIPDRLTLFSLVTSMFLHGGWMHLIGNMWFLWVFGDNIEEILGRGKYLLFYLACGVVAAMTHVFLNPLSRVPMVGASGAIAGVMGAYVVKFPRSSITTLIPIVVFFTTVEVPAYLMLLYWFVLQLFGGWGTIGHSHLSAGGGTAWFAHVGGFLAGVLLILILKTQPRRYHRGLGWR
jgi:membrane associated rhomboid family serine protease